MVILEYESDYFKKFGEPLSFRKKEKVLEKYKVVVEKLRENEKPVIYTCPRCDRCFLYAGGKFADKYGCVYYDCDYIYDEVSLCIFENIFRLCPSCNL